MALYNFKYTLPKGYFLTISPRYEETNLTRAFIYKGRFSKAKLINVADYAKDTPKLEIVSESMNFIRQLEGKIYSQVEVG